MDSIGSLDDCDEGVELEVEFEENEKMCGTSPSVARRRMPGLNGAANAIFVRFPSESSVVDGSGLKISGFVI